MASTLGLEGIEAVFRTTGDQPSLWESLLPEEVLRLSAELARVDALLDDPAFFASFAPHFDPVFGRPSAPAECYLRLMFLKFRYRLGYESLCRQVADSIPWPRLPDPARWAGAASDDTDTTVISANQCRAAGRRSGRSVAAHCAWASGWRWPGRLNLCLAAVLPGGIQPRERGKVGFDPAGPRPRAGQGCLAVEAGQQPFIEQS